MQISQYEVIINEKNATCGFVINLNYFDLKDFLNQSLKYKVYPKDFKVKVFSEDKEIWFINLTDELLYYTYKTDNLAILGGVEGENGEEGQIKIVSHAILA